MIGNKYYKKDGGYKPEVAIWCNDNNATIIDSGDYFEVVALPTKTLEEVKQNKIAEINSIYEQKAEMVKIDVPPSEISTWYIQETEATEWSKDNTKSTPFIDGLANARQVDRIELINRVLNKVNAYKTFMGNLTGQRQFYEDLIDNATTREEIEVIKWNM